jgi:NADPH-dependent F420 reductase
MTDTLPRLAVLGGTGSEGSGLAARWAGAGYTVVIGGRSAEKAQAIADELNVQISGRRVSGATNREAARIGEIIVLTVPYAAQRETALTVADMLKGKILVDVTVPLKPPKVNRIQLPEGGSAVLALQQMLGEDVRVISAFQNISAHHLRDLEHEMDCDVLVTGDDVEAREQVIALALAAGLRGYHAGPLCNSVAAEALTSVLISINQRYKVVGAGIRITGLSQMMRKADDQ